jgi:hypothetical protein
VRCDKFSKVETTRGWEEGSCPKFVVGPQNEKVVIGPANPDPCPHGAVTDSNCIKDYDFEDRSTIRLSGVTI